jgi:hypothetical protein
MENLLKAIASKISGSALASDVAGRIWYGRYRDDPPVIFPYVIYFDVGDNPDNVFAKTGEEYLFQFSIFSASAGMAEITTIRKDLRALFDDCDMTIPPTGTVTDKLIWCKRGSAQTMEDEVTTPEGTSIINHWTQEYEITTQKV